MYINICVDVYIAMYVLVLITHCLDVYIVSYVDFYISKFGWLFLKGYIMP